MELIELEEQHRAAANELKADIAQKEQKEMEEHKAVMAELDQRLRDKDEAITKSVQERQTTIAKELEADGKATKANATDVKEIEKIILQYVK